IVSLSPGADSFIRSEAPASNYGAAGALSVSGAAAVNGSGIQNGSFDSLMRFSTTDALLALDAAFACHDWVITRVTLFLTEMAAPDNAIFNRGIGAFEVRWQAADGWIEGTGRPMAPGTDGVTWDALSGLVNSNLDTS